MTYNELVKYQAERYCLPTSRGIQDSSLKEDKQSEFERVMASGEAVSLIEYIKNEIESHYALVEFSDGTSEMRFDSDWFAEFMK